MTRYAYFLDKTLHVQNFVCAATSAYP